MWNKKYLVCNIMFIKRLFGARLKMGIPYVKLNNPVKCSLGFPSTSAPWRRLTETKIADIETRTETFNPHEALISSPFSSYASNNATNRIAKVCVQLDIQRPVLAKGKKGRSGC